MPIYLTLEFNRNLKDAEIWNIDKLMSFLKNEVESWKIVLRIHDLDENKSFYNCNKIEYRLNFTDKQTKYKPKYQYNTKVLTKLYFRYRFNDICK